MTSITGLQTFTILGVRISATNLQAAARTIQDWIERGHKTYVCVAPVSTVMSCQDDPQYRAIVNNAGMVTPDGMPLVWLARRQGLPQVGRTYGPDVMRAVCGSGGRSVKHFFYGGTGPVLTKMVAVLVKDNPDIEIVGLIAPPFRPLSSAEDDRVVEQINAANPDIVWIGLGSPKQDVWMAEHRDRLNAPVLIGVGAAFDFISGVKPQAPRWVQRSGLEWLFRLACEPRRLWKRYLIGNTRFLAALAREKFTGYKKAEGHVSAKP